MTSTVIVSVLSPDKTGLIAAITGALWEQGVNLDDTSFSVLSGAAEFSAVCELPAGTGIADLEGALQRLEMLADAEITVRALDFVPDAAPPGDITHRISVAGGDQPGLIARLCETFVQFGANIDSLTAGSPADDPARYTIRLDVWIPAETADTCTATVANTAESLGLSCDISLT